MKKIVVLMFLMILNISFAELLRKETVDNFAFQEESGSKNIVLINYGNNSSFILQKDKDTSIFYWKEIPKIYEHDFATKIKRPLAN